MTAQLQDQLQPAEPVIVIEDLHKSFAGFKVLAGINLTMMPGTTTVILGASGSGKTVLMKHIMGLFKPDQGRVIVDGEDITHMPRHQLSLFRTRMGMVFQSAALFDSMTVFENCAFPLREHTELSEALSICMTSNRSTPPNCREACASGWDWPAPSSASPKSCFTTNPPLVSILSPPRASTR